jgi:hypothetical protein
MGIAAKTKRRENGFLAIAELGCPIKKVNRQMTEIDDIHPV